MATHPSILAWSIPQTEEPGGIQSKGSQSVGHNWVANTFACVTLQERKCLFRVFRAVFLKSEQFCLLLPSAGGIRWCLETFFVVTAWGRACHGSHGYCPIPRSARDSPLRTERSYGPKGQYYRVRDFLEVHLEPQLLTLLLGSHDVKFTRTRDSDLSLLCWSPVF